MKVRSVKDSADRYLRNCIRAYLECQPGCDLRWLGSSAPTEVREVLETRFTRYATTDRYRELMARL